MSSYLDGVDPYDHLVTTSSWEPDGDIGSLEPARYRRRSDPHLLRNRLRAGRPRFADLVDQLKSSFGKPVLVGELGIGSGDSESRTGPQPIMGFDPNTVWRYAGSARASRRGDAPAQCVWAAALSESWRGLLVVGATTSPPTRAEEPRGLRLPAERTARAAAARLPRTARTGRRSDSRRRPSPQRAQSRRWA